MGTIAVSIGYISNLMGNNLLYALNVVCRIRLKTLQHKKGMNMLKLLRGDKNG